MITTLTVSKHRVRVSPLIRMYRYVSKSRQFHKSSQPSLLSVEPLGRAGGCAPPPPMQKLTLQIGAPATSLLSPRSRAKRRPASPDARGGAAGGGAVQLRAVPASSSVLPFGERSLGTSAEGAAAALKESPRPRTAEMPLPVPRPLQPVTIHVPHIRHPMHHHWSHKETGPVRIDQPCS